MKTFKQTAKLEELFSENPHPSPRFSHHLKENAHWTLSWFLITFRAEVGDVDTEHYATSKSPSDRRRTAREVVWPSSQIICRAPVSARLARFFLLFSSFPPSLHIFLWSSWKKLIIVHQFSLYSFVSLLDGSVTFLFQTRKIIHGFI